MKRVLLGLLLACALQGADDEYLTWDSKRAAQVALAQRANGKVGRSLDLRVIATDRSYNYKLRATWMTPEAIRASARLQQIARALSAAETRKLVEEAEAVKGTVIMVEIDPREGSGVIPRDWVATFGPVAASETPGRSVRGLNDSKLRDLLAFAGGARRDYAYEVFWVVFPLTTEDGGPLFGANDKEAELSVHIHDKIGRVRWPIAEFAHVKP